MQPKTDRRILVPYSRWGNPSRACERCGTLYLLAVTGPQCHCGGDILTIEQGEPPPPTPAAKPWWRRWLS